MAPSKRRCDIGGCTAGTDVRLVLACIYICAATIYVKYICLICYLHVVFTPQDASPMWRLTRINVINEADRRWDRLGHGEKIKFNTI
ncbi:hypothetical protein D3C79_1027850 [compost metagenome]